MASTTADRGSLSTEATAAPIPTVTAGVIEKPGSCAAISPAAAPRNSAGKTGPPRKAPSEIDQAMPLKAMSRASAVSDHVLASDTRGPTAFWPEKSTWSTPLSVVSAKAIAKPATAIAASGRNTNGRTMKRG